MFSFSSSSLNTTNTPLWFIAFHWCLPLPLDQVEYNSSFHFQSAKKLKEGTRSPTCGHTERTVLVILHTSRVNTHTHTWEHESKIVWGFADLKPFDRSTQMSESDVSEDYLRQPYSFIIHLMASYLAIYPRWFGIFIYCVDAERTHVKWFRYKIPVMGSPFKFCLCGCPITWPSLLLSWMNVNSPEHW